MAASGGDDVGEYNPRRFLTSRKEQSARPLLPRGRRGKTLCPSRHFATNEILAVVAAFIAIFDMKLIGGEWRVPITTNTNVVAVVIQPDHDIDIQIKTCQGFEDIE